MLLLCDRDSSSSGSASTVQAAPFIEFDMSAEGFGCLFLPSIAPHAAPGGVGSATGVSGVGAALGQQGEHAVIGGIGTGQSITCSPVIVF